MAALSSSDWMVSYLRLVLLASMMHLLSSGAHPGTEYLGMLLISTAASTAGLNAPTTRLAK